MKQLTNDICLLNFIEKPKLQNSSIASKDKIKANKHTERKKINGSQIGSCVGLSPLHCHPPPAHASTPQQPPTQPLPGHAVHPPSPALAVPSPSASVSHAPFFPDPL